MALGTWILGIFGAAYKELPADQGSRLVAAMAIDYGHQNVLPPGSPKPKLKNAQQTPATAPATAKEPETSPTMPTTVAEPITPPTVAQAPQVFVAQAARLRQYAHGADISWPQSNCDAILPEGLQFGIVGVNGGKNLTANDCLVDEVNKFAAVPGLGALSFYVNTGYKGLEVVKQHPDFFAGIDPASPDYENQVAYRYGFHAGQFAMQQLIDNNLRTETVWLDVENGNTGNAWSGNPQANVQSLQGQIDGMSAVASQNGRVAPAYGFYSTTYMWTEITGGWQNGLPSWVATGSQGFDNAVAHCVGYEFTGGPTHMVQYVDDQANAGRGLDMDIIC